MINQYAGNPHRRYDPLLNERRSRKKLSTGAMVGIIISVIVHAGLFFYLWKVNFQPHYDPPPPDPGVSLTMAHPLLTSPPPPPPTIARTSPSLAPHLTPTPTIPTTPLQFEPTLQPPDEPLTPPVTLDPTPPQPPTMAQPARSAAPPVITSPDWVRQPNGDDLAQYYPDRAQRLEKTGGASIQCTVTTSGSLSGCRVLSETPAGFGFGEATLKVARLFRMKPAMQGGQAVQGIVTIPLVWQLK